MSPYFLTIQGFSSKSNSPVKVHFFKKGKKKKNDEIFTGDWTLCSKCQIDGDYFINFCGLLRKHELYLLSPRNLEKKQQLHNPFL